MFHTSDSRPDLLLESGTHRIGIEASRLTTEAYERLERLRARRQTGPVITISAALVTTAHLRNDELIGMSLPGAQGWGRAVDAEDSYIQQALRVIGRKTKIRRAAAYRDYGHNWLLLWDKLSIRDPDFLSRPRLLQSWLKSYWNEKNRFDMMIIESEEFSRFAILTSGELRWLPVAPARATGPDAHGLRHLATGCRSHQVRRD